MPWNFALINQPDRIHSAFFVFVQFLNLPLSVWEIPLAVGQCGVCSGQESVCLKLQPDKNIENTGERAGRGKRTPSILAVSHVGMGAWAYFVRSTRYGALKFV